MFQKVNWSDTSDICSSKSLLEEAREKSGSGNVMFITYNDTCDSVDGEAIVRYAAREYPQNIVYERLCEEWGKGVNAFIWGDDLVGDDIEESYGNLCDYVIMESGDADKVEDEVFDREWSKFCEARDLDIQGKDMFDKFVGFITFNGVLGSFGVEYDDKKCYDYIMSDSRKYNEDY